MFVIFDIIGPEAIAKYGESLYNESKSIKLYEWLNKYKAWEKWKNKSHWMSLMTMVNYRRRLLFNHFLRNLIIIANFGRLLLFIDFMSSAFGPDDPWAKATKTHRLTQIWFLLIFFVLFVIIGYVIVRTDFSIHLFNTIIGKAILIIVTFILWIILYFLIEPIKPYLTIFFLSPRNSTGLAINRLVFKPLSELLRNPRLENILKIISVLFVLIGFHFDFLAS